MEKLKETLSFVGTFLVFLIGGYDSLLQTLAIVMVVDYITGVASAVYNKELSSRIGLKGILKKFAYLCVIALSVEVDNIIGANSTIRDLVIYFFIANDGISVLENIAELNIPIPKVLRNVLEQLKEKGDGESGD